jgi:hypothetical protein
MDAGALTRATLTSSPTYLEPLRSDRPRAWAIG